MITTVPGAARPTTMKTTEELTAEALNPEPRWRALRFYNGMRLAIAAFVIIAALIAPRATLWVSPLQPALVWLGGGYLLLAISWYITIALKRPGVIWQSHIQLSLDMLMISALIHASGGLGSGLGTLILAPVAVAGLILPTRMAVLYAAVASIILLGEQFWLGFSDTRTPLWTQAAVLGVMAFIAALGAGFLARRVQETEALAERRRQDLQTLARLNEIVIRNMHSGIVVIDRDQHIRLLNAEAARLLLDKPEQDVTGRPLRSVSPALGECAVRWLAGDHSSHTLAAVGQATDITPHFTPLGHDGRVGTLIVLEDLSLIRHRMQEMKLAALGRLTASIAHEIRNPLAAMTQAGQLLAEDGAADTDEEKRRLTDMILRQGQRINGIVESVLQLSRQPAAQPGELDLAQWLPEAVARYREECGSPGPNIDLHFHTEHTRVPVDPAHLTQVLWNLLDNARQHGAHEHGETAIRVEVGHFGHGHQVHLDVLDNGPGITQNPDADIFEPFFTTSHQGTGLGLFISRELCEFNGATLSVVSHDGPGACFRISFAAHSSEH